MAEVAGKLMAITLDGTGLAYSRDFSVSLDTETIDITSRDTAWWRRLLRGMRSWSISGSGLYSASAAGKQVLQAWYNDSTDAAIAVVLTLADGTITLGGDGILTNLSYDGPHADAATYSFSIEGTGALTQSSS